jgi:membrane-bound lytic murein transglycosylase B
LAAGATTFAWGSRIGLAVIAALALAGLSDVAAKTPRHAPTPASAKGFPAWRAHFIEKLIADKTVEAGAAHRILDNVTFDPNVVAILERTSSFRPPMRDYLVQHVTPDMIARGRELMAANADLLAAIEAKYQVDRTAIIAVWCMETRFGEAELKYDAVRSLATLAYASPRKAFFGGELATLTTLIARGAVKSDHPKASIDGGLGQTQFMPDAFMRFAVDWDKDGVADIWKSTPDALASIAAYLADAGWKRGAPYFAPAKAGGGVKAADEKKKQSLEDWARAGVTPAGGSYDITLNARAYQPDAPRGGWLLAFDNFAAFKRYNGGSRYATAASLLADGFAGKPLPDPMWPAPADELSVDDITALQIALDKAGFEPGPADGRYGEKTWKAINAFLRKKGEAPVDYPTRSVLSLIQAAH